MLAARGDVERDRWLFQTRYGTPVNCNHFRDKVVLPALHAAGLLLTTRTYDLRHSHASLLIDLGANPLAVAQRMGHSDPSVTLRVYDHLFEGTQAKLSEQLDALERLRPTGRKRAMSSASKTGASGHGQDNVRHT